MVAYSPIGRPDLYVGTTYYISNQGVNFKEGIANAPKGTAYATEEDGSEIPNYTPATDYNADYSGNASEYSPQNTAGGTTNYSRASGSNQDAGQNGAIIIAGNSSKSAQGTATQSNDVSSLSSDLTLTSSASTDRQAVGPNRPNGGRDPGGKNPKNPIPAGDGGFILLLMASAFAIWKKQQATRANTTT